MGKSIAVRDGLTAKRIEFIDEFMANGREASKAYAKAYPKVKYPAQCAYHLLQLPVVREEVNRRIAEYSEKCGIERIAVLERLHKTFLVDIAKAFTANGGIAPPSEWSDELKLAITGYNAGTVTAAEKISFIDRVKLGFDLLEATAQMPVKTSTVKHEITVADEQLDFDNMVAELRAKNRPAVIDVTPE